MTGPPALRHAARRGLRALLVMGLLLAVTAPGIASGQGANPFDGLPPTPQTTPAQPTTTTTTTAGDDGLERWQQTLIFLTGVILLAGIAFAIVRDARKTAPVTADEAAGAHQSNPAGARKGHSKAKARKKAKAARAARKQNR